MRYSILLALGLVFAACGGQDAEQAQQDHDHHEHDADVSHPEMRAAEGGDVAGETDATARGIVRVVGNEPSPQVVLSLGEGAAATQMAIVGEFRAELGRLSGVEVSVSGSYVTNPQGIPEQAIEVVDYDVVAVNSAPAFLGVLEMRDGEMWLGRENALQLTAVPDEFEDLTGAKVWIAGPVDGTELRVQSYGVVRER